MTVLKKIGILLSGLLFIRCSNSTPADYYSYLENMKDVPQGGAVDFNKLQFNCDLTDRFMIKDLSKVENICFNINFRGVPKIFPEDLSIQFLVNDKQFTLPDTVNYSLRTSINREGKTYTAALATYNVNEVITQLKARHGIPDSAYFIELFGGFTAIPYNNTENPEKIKIELKAISKGKVIFQKTRNYELKRPSLYKTRSRPFG